MSEHVSNKLRELDQLMATPPMDEDWLLPPEEETKALARFRNLMPELISVVEAAELYAEVLEDAHLMKTALAALDEALS